MNRAFITAAILVSAATATANDVHAQDRLKSVDVGTSINAQNSQNWNAENVRSQQARRFGEAGILPGIHRDSSPSVSAPGLGDPEQRPDAMPDLPFGGYPEIDNRNP